MHPGEPRRQGNLGFSTRTLLLHPRSASTRLRGTPRSLRKRKAVSIAVPLSLVLTLSQRAVPGLASAFDHSWCSVRAGCRRTAVVRRGGPRASGTRQTCRPAVASTTLVRLSCRPLLSGLGPLGGGRHMLSSREQGFQVSVCPLPLGGALEEDALAGRDLLRRPVRESRRFLTPLHGT